MPHHLCGLSVPRRHGLADSKKIPSDFGGALQSLLRQQFDGGIPRFLHQIEVPENVSEAEAERARLPGAEKLARSAQLEIALGDVEAILGLGEDSEPFLLRI